MARYEVTVTANLVANTPKTLVQVATPGTRKLTLRRLEIVDRLAAASDSGLLYRILSGGTGAAGTAATPTPMNDAKACLSSALVNLTTEATTPTEVERGIVPAGGGVVQTYEGDEGIEIPHSSAIGVEITAEALRAANGVGVRLIFEE